MDISILLQNNFTSLHCHKCVDKQPWSILGTLFSNLAYYGYVPSKELVEILTYASDKSLNNWWLELEPVLKTLSGDSRNMDKFVVYKNFPQEVLDMTQGEYWCKQILMYIGFPNDWFTQEEIVRNKLFEKQTLKVLHLAKTDSLKTIFNNLLAKPSKLTDEEMSWLKHFINHHNYKIDITKIVFKTNMAEIAKLLIEKNEKLEISSATDILRIMIALSDGDITLKTNSKFRSFSRRERRYLLDILNDCTNLEEDFARHKNRWKKALRNLHPFDYPNSYPNVIDMMDKLYNNQVKSFNAKVEKAIFIANMDKTLKLLEKRPGVFARNLYRTISLYGSDAVKSFKNIADKLSVYQLLKLRKHIETLDRRKYLTVTPKNSWMKLQILENNKSFGIQKTPLLSIINKELSNKLPLKVNLDIETLNIKLPNNNQELATYGQGTTFSIPDNIQFIRSASYWKTASGSPYNTWFDNGWNFFDKNWKTKGNCSWTSTRLGNAAVFSGDPTNSKTNGAACQMIDLYLDELKKLGIRYAVWNILCYSRIKFSQAQDVFGTLQWGEDAQSGKLFEPSRCQLAFPIKSDTFSKYLAYIDIDERKVIYMDVDFKSSVRSADYNVEILQKNMPAFVEYLDSIPSVYDLFDNCKQSKNGMPVLYSDNEVKLNGQEAYVFKPENSDNKFKAVKLNKFLV